MSFTIIIPTHGRATLLRRTLASLAECDFPNEFCETIVIENGSRDGAEQVCREYESACRIRYLHEPIGNKSHALNRVLNEVPEGLLIFFDDDVRIAPHTLRAYVEAAGSQSNVFFGGPTGVDHEGTAPPEWLCPFLPPSHFEWQPENPMELVKEPVFMGYNWAAKAEDLRNLGGFNEQVGPGAKTQSTGQEAEMQSRLLAAGLSGKYVANAKVWHYIPLSQCTPQWALKRAFRHAVYEGLNMTDHSTLLFNAPRWLWKKTAVQFCKATVSTPFMSREESFRLWYLYYQLRGIVHGCQQRAKSQIEKTE